MEIAEYNATLDAAEAKIATLLVKLVEAKLPEAAGKVWHGHPVWFINENPVVGYSLKKAGVQVLFWSGQSFKTTGLKAIGKFKAAGLDIPNLEVFNQDHFSELLAEAKTIQWDYANLPKKRALEKLTKF